MSKIVTLFFSARFLPDDGRKQGKTGVKYRSEWRQIWVRFRQIIHF